MKQYTMINRFTKQLVIVQARNSMRARIAANELANHDYDNRCYWIVKQDYHDVQGYIVLSV